VLNVQEREALEAQMEVENRIREARIHEEESRRLQAELERARLEMEENQRKLQEALASPKVLYVREHDDDNKASGLFSRSNSKFNGTSANGVIAVLASLTLV
jgi:hypothetical protein